MGKKSKRRSVEQQYEDKVSKKKNKKVTLVQSDTEINNEVINDDCYNTVITKTKTKMVKCDKSPNEIEAIEELEIYDSKNKHKKSKKSVNCVATDNNLQTEINDYSTKKAKKKNQAEKAVAEDIHENSHQVASNNHNKKNKRMLQQTSEQEVNFEDSQQETSKKNKKNKKEKEQNIVEGVHQGEDSHQEIVSENNKKGQKKRKRKIVEEEVINDEDIDRYCEELDDVHNKQYDDWVKLIEANLNANKKNKN